MLIGNKVRYYREKYNITQSELADKVGVSKQYISRLEREQSNVNIGLALELVFALKEITKEKTFGLQMVKIQVEDLFYIANKNECDQS